jgi:DNA repair exonuclease SbcCD ATPase subunit
MQLPPALADKHPGIHNGGTAMATKKVDATLRALNEIRDEIRGTNARLDSNVERLDSHIGRLDARIDGLSSVVHESSVRISTELIAVAEAVRDVKVLLSKRDGEGERIVDHERRLARLEKKVG